MSITEIPTARADSRGDRLPPQDMAAEQCVLGSMLLSKDAIADVVEYVKGADYYRPAHETIHDAILDLYGRGEPADAVTVAAELGKQGELGRTGGAPYLHTLIASVPSAANAAYYAEIVREKAILRRLVDAGTRILQLGYGAEGEVDQIVDAAQAEIYGVTERRASEDYAPLSELLEATLDEIEAASARDGKLIGVPTGFADLDRLTTGLHPGQLIVIAARPGMGKSTLGLDFARAAAIHHNLPTVIFSLEMGRTEITMKLLSAESRVAAAEHAPGLDARRGLGEAVAQDGRRQRGAAVHRRQPEPVDDRDPGEVPPAEAAQQPQAGDRRLPAADDLGQEGREPAAGGRGVQPLDEAARQGARGPGGRPQPAEPGIRSSATTRSRSCPTCASPARSNRTPTW